MENLKSKDCTETFSKKRMVVFYKTGVQRNPGCLQKQICDKSEA